MDCNKPPQRNEEGLFLDGFEVALREALKKLSKRGKETDTNDDLRGPKSRCITRHPCVPNLR